MVILMLVFADNKDFLNLLIFFPMLLARGGGKAKVERECVLLKGQRKREECVI